MSSEGESFDSSGSEDEDSLSNLEDTSMDKPQADTWYKRESGEEDKGAGGDSQEPSVWNLQELGVIDGIKDKWFLGNASEKTSILQEVVAELLEMGGQNPERLKRRVRRWLNKKCSTRKKFGPGRPPSLRTILYWYKQREMETVVKENYGVSPGDKRGQFVGHLATEMSKYQRKLKEDPSMAKELEQCQKYRHEWAQVGIPAKRKKQYVDYLFAFWKLAC